MKIKTDFVTNSSSVSFMLEKSKISYSDMHKIKELKNHKDLNFFDDYGYGEDDLLEFSIGDRDDKNIEDKINKTLKTLGRFSSCGYIDRDR